MRDVGDFADLQHILAGVRDALGEERFRVRAGGGAPRVEVVGVLDEDRFDAEAGEGVLEQVERAAVQARGDDHGVAGDGDVEDREGDGALPGGDEQPRGPAFERRDAVFDSGDGRVGDARVDGARVGEREPVGGGLRVGEHERRGTRTR